MNRAAKSLSDARRRKKRMEERKKTMGCIDISVFSHLVVVLLLDVTSIYIQFFSRSHRSNEHVNS